MWNLYNGNYKYWKEFKTFAAIFSKVVCCKCVCKWERFKRNTSQRNIAHRAGLYIGGKNGLPLTFVGDACSGRGALSSYVPSFDQKLSIVTLNSAILYPNSFWNKQQHKNI